MLLLAEAFLRTTGNASSPTITTRTCSIHHSLLVPSATTHHEMQRLTEVEIFPGIQFSTNSLGLRGPQPAASKTRGTIRVLVLGDETILGAHLNTDQTVSGRLRQFIAHAGQPVEVINAGIPGFCPLLSWLQFEHELQKLKPDVVVLHFDMTDVADDSGYRSFIRSEASQQICCNALLNKKRMAGNPLVGLVCESSVCSWFRTKTGVMAGSKRKNQLTERYEWTQSSQSNLKMPIQHAVQPIQSFSRAASSQGFQLLVATSPVPWQAAEVNAFPTLAASVATHSNWPVTEDLPQKILSAFCDKLGVTFCDSTAQFRNFSKPSKLFLNDDCRLSNYGTALYAREIAAKILSSQFSPSRNVGGSVH